MSTKAKAAQKATEDTWTLQRFRLAGQAHVHAARALLHPPPGQTAPPALVPSSAAYLAQVALECAMKARLLFRGNFPSAERLSLKHPKVYEELFRSRKGHDVNRLATELRLKGLLETQGSPLANDACWNRVCSSERPYSLRYGAEHLSSVEAREDVDRASSVVEALFAGIGKMGGKRG